MYKNKPVAHFRWPLLMVATFCQSWLNRPLLHNLSFLVLFLFKSKSFVLCLSFLKSTALKNHSWQPLFQAVPWMPAMHGRPSIDHTHFVSANRGKDKAGAKMWSFVIFITKAPLMFKFMGHNKIELTLLLILLIFKVIWTGFWYQAASVIEWALTGSYQSQLFHNFCNKQTKHLESFLGSCDVRNTLKFWRLKVRLYIRGGASMHSGKSIGSIFF